MLDNKGRLFGKVSIVDLLVVVIIAVMLVGAFTAYQKIHNKSILTENKSLVQNNIIFVKCQRFFVANIHNPHIKTKKEG